MHFLMVDMALMQIYFTQQKCDDAMILCLFRQVKNLKDIQVFTSLPYLTLHLKEV